jgi:hypothetical protein
MGPALQVIEKRHVDASKLGNSHCFMVMDASSLFVFLHPCH